LNVQDTVSERFISQAERKTLAEVTSGAGRRFVVELVRRHAPRCGTARRRRRGDSQGDLGDARAGGRRGGPGGGDAHGAGAGAHPQRPRGPERRRGRPCGDLKW